MSVPEDFISIGDALIVDRKNIVSIRKYHTTYDGKWHLDVVIARKGTQWITGLPKVYKERFDISGSREVIEIAYQRVMVQLSGVVPPPDDAE